MRLEVNFTHCPQVGAAIGRQLQDSYYPRFPRDWKSLAASWPRAGTIRTMTLMAPRGNDRTFVERAGGDHARWPANEYQVAFAQWE
jgi:hypothetical protein